ncbi:hypothetical protein [Marininema halotolerans]|uniref:Membrane domain of glycerophosphoryl diester phosphodiesterase n=1 Tax=Marininema halotolerans TaxID=1155944 RepID=A0A1I6S7T0_9BACL|nr:hypothetical protein [Marininema halotolerans]SFS73011.1 hypothetical protein SAMN05444972_106205 [Marininema halotolerans]
MRESLRLFNRFGMKLWLSSLAGGLFAIILLMIPHLFIGAMIRTNWSDANGFFKLWATSFLTDASYEQVIQLVVYILDQGGPLLIIYTAFGALLTFLVATYYIAGLVSTIHDAVTDHHVVISHFFTEGLRKTFSLLGLFLCHMVMTGLFLAAIGALVILSGLKSGALIVTGIIGGVIYLFLLIIKTYSLVILFSEELGVFRSLSYSFRSLFGNFLSTLTTFLTTYFTALLGAVVIGGVALFPWFVLQFFKDGTVALMVGVIIGGLALVLLGSLPVILTLIVLFTRYTQVIQGDLFPEDHLQATLLRPTSHDKDWEATSTERIYRT